MLATVPKAVPATTRVPASPAMSTSQLGTSPELSLGADALSAVAQFMAESRVLEEMAAAYMAADELAREAEEAEAAAAADADAAASAEAKKKAREEKKAKELSMQVFPEQWGMSQFWNDENTARTLAEECVAQAKGGTIALISSPSVFLMLKKMNVPNRLLLLEFDTRFSVFPEFHAYDYARPLSVGSLSRSQISEIRASVVLLDPPYINPDCFSKSATTARMLSTPSTKIIACTGWKIRDTVKDVLDARMVKFRPGHSCGLATTFRAYVNYDGVGIWDLDEDPENGDNDGTAFAGAGGVEAAP